MSSDDVFIVAAARTPIGSFNGSLAKIPAADLGKFVIEAILERAGVSGSDVSEVILGQVLTAGQGQNPARQAALRANIPLEVPAYSINMLCGSGLKSVVLGYQSIKCGDSVISICGGQENMSLSPHAINLRQGIKMGPGTMIDTMVHDGLTDAMCNIHMGITAENLAKEYGLDRQSQDEFAARSQNLAELAQKNGYFDSEIIPIQISDGKKTTVCTKDEFIRYGTTVETLSKLRPCFMKDGTVTAGNSSGVNDCASAVLLMGESELKKRNLKPLAKIVGWAQAGVKPEVMGIGPVPAVQKLLQKVGWTMDEVDLFELNEAFAAQALSVNKCLNIAADKLNVCGGAIALGHPIGASGNRILVTLIHSLMRLDRKKGIAALCVGGGMGIAIAVERVTT